ncbi:MAG: beta-lactamase family protein [Chitinophagaceae bacterium]|nr:beta-lactamase family protein [Chitinophagaceae bacterium]
MKKSHLLMALFALFLSGSAKAQEYRPPVFKDASRVEKIKAVMPKLDALFSKYAADKKFPSLSYGVVVDGQLIHNYYQGIINQEKNIKASSVSDYHIASMTKSVTAMAIVKLRDEGKISLDDPIEKFIPEAKGLKTLTSDAQLITVRDLLIHNAGFPEDNPWGDRQLGRTSQWLKDFYSAGISFSTAPGSGYEYSNLGFGTLGLIIQNVTGQTYQEYITENIFKPLGMDNTYWDYEDVPESQLAVGYRMEDGKWVPQPLLHSGIFGAMGGLITTIEDFAKYMSFHLSAWPPRDDAETGPVKRSSVREMHHGWNFSRVWEDETDFTGKACPILDFYGYGLHIYQDCNNMKVISHSGGLPGFGSQWRILPDYGIGIVAFANHTYASMGAPLQAAIDSLLLYANFQPRQLPPSPILEKRKDQLVSLLPSWKGAKESGIFADNFFDDYFVNQLKKQAEELFASIGKVKEVTEVDPLNQLRGSFLIKGEKGKLQVYFTLSPETDPKIQAYRMSVVK